MQEFYVQRKVIPTICTLTQVLKEKIYWRWSGPHINRLFKEMGFMWKRSINKQLVYTEQADVFACHSKYLIKMKQFRADGKHFVWTSPGSTPT
jgi:hypothetical protein